MHGKNQITFSEKTPSEAGVNNYFILVPQTICSPRQ